MDGGSYVALGSSVLRSMNVRRPQTKAQHTVPRMHLQQFAGQEPPGQVWTYDKNTGLSRSAVPEETGIFTHFYSKQREDGSYDTSVEAALSDVETRAAPVYAKMIAGHLPTGDQERVDFSVFAGLLYLRTTAMRRDMGNLIGRNHQIMSYFYASHDKAFATLIRGVERERGAKISPEVLAKVRQAFLDPSMSTVQVPKEMTLSVLDGVDKLSSLLFQMRWALVKPRHGYFITSDNPLTRSVKPETVHQIYGDHGFLNPTAEVTLPLTPHLMLRMGWDAIPEQAIINRETVDIINQQRALFAEQFIYSHVLTKKLRRLAQSYAGSRPSLTTEGFGPETFGKIEVPRRNK